MGYVKQRYVCYLAAMSPSTKRQLTSLLLQVLGLTLEPLLDGELLLLAGALVERVAKGDDIAVLIDIDVDVTVDDLEAVDTLAEVDVGDAVVLGSVGILDDVVGIGQLLLDKVEGDPLRVGCRAGKVGMVVIVDTKVVALREGRRSMEFLMGEFRAEWLDGGTVGGCDREDGGEERVRLSL